MFTRETPAGFSRLLYSQVKMVRDHLRAYGFELEEIYFAIASAVVRLAMEDGGRERARAVLGRLMEDLALVDDEGIVARKETSAGREVRH